MDSNLNIWIINENTGSRIHGMVFRPYYLAKKFVEKGNKVTIFSGSYSHVYSTIPQTDGKEGREIIDGINYCWIKTPKYKKSQSIGRVFNAFVYLFKLFLTNKKDYGKPDTVIVTSPTPFSIINGWYYKKKYNAQLIFEVRDIWPLTLIELGNISKLHPFIIFTQLFENFAYKVADLVVSVLPKSKDHMILHGMKSEKFIHIPNGIDLSEIASKKLLSEENVKLIPREKFIVMYAGKIGVSNALEYLIFTAEKMKENSSIHFVVVGNGSEKEKLLEIVRQKDIRNITFLNPVAKDEVQSLLSFADVFYIGWHKNNLYKHGVSANKLYDYMYAAKPVIHSVQIDSNDSIKEAGCGISVDAENSDKIADAILSLYKMSKNEREAMGAKGREYILKHHTYKKLSEQYLDIMKK